MSNYDEFSRWKKILIAPLGWALFAIEHWWAILFIVAVVISLGMLGWYGYETLNKPELDCMEEFAVAPPVPLAFTIVVREATKDNTIPIEDAGPIPTVEDAVWRYNYETGDLKLNALLDNDIEFVAIITCIETDDSAFHYEILEMVTYDGAS